MYFSSEIDRHFSTIVLGNSKILFKYIQYILLIGSYKLPTQIAMNSYKIYIQNIPLFDLTIKLLIEVVNSEAVSWPHVLVSGVV